MVLVRSRGQYGVLGWLGVGSPGADGYLGRSRGGEMCDKGRRRAQSQRAVAVSTKPTVTCPVPVPSLPSSGQVLLFQVQTFNGQWSGAILADAVARRQAATNTSAQTTHRSARRQHHRVKRMRHSASRLLNNRQSRGSLSLKTLLCLPYVKGTRAVTLP